MFEYVLVVGTLLHNMHEIRGYLYKKPEQEKMFNKGKFYKRYFIINNKQNFVQVQEERVTKKFK